MTEYKVEVRTGDMAHAQSRDHIWVTLIGTNGQSQKIKLDVWGRDFRKGSVSTQLLMVDLSDPMST